VVELLTAADDGRAERQSASSTRRTLGHVPGDAVPRLAAENRERLCRTRNILVSQETVTRWR